MKEQEVFYQFIKLIEEFVKKPEKLQDVTKTTNIINDLKVNSARLVDIIIKAEDDFDVEIDDDDADSIRTIGDVVDVIMRKIEPAEVFA